MALNSFKTVSNLNFNTNNSNWQWAVLGTACCGQTAVPGSNFIWGPNNNPNTTSYFRKKFVIDTVTCNPIVMMKADNASSIWINGTFIGSASGWTTLYTFNVPANILIPNDTNLIAIQAIDWGYVYWASFRLDFCDTITVLPDTVSVIPPSYIVNLTSQTNLLCFGNATGSATVIASGGTSPYTYTWNTTPIQYGTTANNLTAGTYTVTVKDANNYTITTNVTITQPTQLVATISSQTNVLCFGNSTGSATATANGGTSPYTYTWNTNPVQYGATATNLSAGTYTVTVKDANNCTATANVTITQPTQLTANISSQTNVPCFGNATGSATATANSGTSPYTYTWNTSPVQYGATASNLVAGTYTVTVKDANNCTTTANVTITQPTQLTANISNQTDVLCFGNATGNATATASGGTSSYTFTWNTNPTQYGATASNLAAGTYTVTVKDANNCTTTANVTISQPTQLSANISSQTDVLCFGNATGNATATASGGTSPYTFTWNTNPVQYGATASNLVAGTYTVTVKDANNCSTTANVTITQPTQLTANISNQTNVLCFGNATGNVTATASGGTSPYTFTWNTNPVQYGATASNLAAGTYTVTVKDANNCTTTANVTITQPTQLTANISNQTDVLCFGNATGNATVTANGGTSPYTYTWNTNPIQYGSTASNLVAGTYTVTVKDANNCAAAANVTITQPTQLTANISNQTNVLCFGNATGSATATASGGTSPYTFTWNTNPVQYGATASNLAAGTYTVTVKDANNCSTTANVTITQPTQLTANISNQTNVLCFGNATGSATVTASGGTSPYTFIWNTSPVQYGATASNLAAGTYTVTVKDANNCTTTANVTISQPTQLSANISNQTDVLCFGNATGSATATASGGTSSYTFTWNTNPVQYGATASNLAAGTYTVTVKDANNCSTTANVTISQPTQLTANISSTTNVLCFGNATGSATATASGGTSSYTFTWNTSPVQYGTTASNLAVGTYTVTVKDANNCSTTANVTISQPTQLTANISSTTNVLCFGNATGSATATASGGTSPYTFTWNTNPVQYGATASNLVAGTYTVTVKDANNCTATASVTIIQPNAALSANIIGTNINCNTTGAANLTVTGGTSPYTYSWSNGATTQDLTNISAGTYNVTITDANGCVATASVTITQTATLSATIAGTNILCFGNATGAADLSVIGGAIPYTYSWSNGATTQDLTGLLAGTYSVVVTDSNGCITSASVSILQPAAALTANIAGTNVLCFGANTGAADLSVTGGTIPYAYSWSNGTTNQDLITLTAGTYNVTITDANGCTKTASVTITQPNAALSANIIGTNVLCYGGNTGAANLTVSGGTSPYTYSWSNGAVTQDLINISADTFHVTITDTHNCTTTGSVIISQPNAALSANIAGTNVLCFGGNTGAANLSVNGGTSPYTYSWSNGATSQDLTNIPDGTYNVSITDSNGCTTSASVSISEPTLLVASSTAGTILCNGGSTTVNVTATGGTAPYTGTGTFTVNAGNYTYTVTDANGCVATTSEMFIAPSPINISVSTQQNVLCFGGNDGSINVNAIGGTGNLAYSWSNGQIGNAISNLDTGVYTIFVTDANNCQAQLPIAITQSSDIIINSVAIQQASCNGATDGSIIINASGGTGTFVYSWDNGQIGNNLNNLSIGTYTVFVTDSNNCVKSQSYTISQPNPITINSLNTTDVSCFGGTNGTATASATGGTGVLTYAWSNGQTGTNASNLSAGNYTLFVTDANSCSTSQSFTISQPTQIQIDSIIIDSVNCAGTNTGGASVSAFGGTGTLSYTWSNGQVGQNLSNVLAGTYTVSISDSNSCQISQSLNVLAPSPLQVSATVLATACNNTATGMAQINAIGGVGTYTYSWNNGQTTQIADSLASGTYTFVVTDANGCASNGSVNIVPFTIQLTQTNVSCFGGNNGITSVFPTGGLGNYSYSWSNGATTATINNLQAGTYIVSVQDITSCIITDTINITQPNQLLAAANLLQMVNCFGNSTGSANVMVNGGTSPYTYTWNTIPIQYGQTATNLATGTYTVIVTDANACNTSSSIFIPENPAIQTTTQALQNVSCFGGNNGSANVQANGGAGGYTYTWNTLPPQYGNIANNLTSGTYIVTIADSLHCLAFDTVYIAEPQAINISYTLTNIACFGENTGSIVSNVTGGVSPYTYTWNTGLQNANLSNLPAGTYTLTVTDANLCTKTASITLTEPLPIQSAVNEANVSCFGGNDGNAFVAVSGGVPSYTYSWNNWQTTNPATNLAAGTYFVQITDANGCTHLDTAYITQPAMLNVTAKQDTAFTLCFGASNGHASSAVSGGTTPYTYSWDNGETTASAQQLNAGFHILWLSDGNDCRDSVQFFMQQSPKIEIEQVQIDSAYCNLANGSAAAIASGGNGDFTYTWNSVPPQYSPILQNVIGGTYILFAIDKKGCIDSLAVEIPNIAPPVAYFTSTPDNSQKILEEDLILFKNQSTGAYLYKWDFGDGNSSNLKNPTHSYPDTSVNVVTLTAFDKNMACPDSYSLIYHISPQGTIYLPNAFTPNKDGNNDFFSIAGQGVTEMQCIIYDRWGKVIIILQSLSQTWDGTFQGQACPEDVYTYRIKARLNNGNILERGGTITLLR